MYPILSVRFEGAENDPLAANGNFSHELHTYDQGYNLSLIAMCRQFHKLRETEFESSSSLKRREKTELKTERPGVFSNSFVINEGYILGFVLLTVVSIHIMCSGSSLASLGITFSGIDENKFVKLPVVRRHFRCSWTSFVCLAVLIRLGHVFFRCREELQEYTEVSWFCMFFL